MRFRIYIYSNMTFITKSTWSWIKLSRQEVPNRFKEKQIWVGEAFGKNRVFVFREIIVCFGIWSGTESKRK
jgi:hypothetical protein